MTDKQFWEGRYRDHQTGWDMGCVSPPLKAYADQLTRKDMRVLIPGAGNSHEAKYLLKKGFSDVTVLDIASPVINRLREDMGEEISKRLHLVEGDFFLHRGTYDLILEQTFFCAINPDKRREYTEKCHELLRDQGKVVGVLFNVFLDFGPPPYGGKASDYVELFDPYFDFRTWEACYNSFPPRAGMEWFMILEKKRDHSKNTG